MRYVDLPALCHLSQGLTFEIGQCAEILDDALISLNEATGLPDQLVAWIQAGAHNACPCPSDGLGRIIVDLDQITDAIGQNGYLAAVTRNPAEPETGPMLALNMRSPLLDIPMRVELPLRAVLIGNAPLIGTYTLYLHALLTDRGETYTYYGVTKRGWAIRFNEHTRASVKQKSKRLLATRLNALIEARVGELYGRPNDRPKLGGLISVVCGTGMSRDAALDAEERMVDKYSLASKHPFGLNMIPGGLAGMRQARHFLRQR